jgi:nucleotide-binding universal stress UspA family protein
MIKRILVPLDGSALAESVLPVAAQVTRALEGTLILLRVYDVTSTDFIVAVMEAEAEQAQTYLARVALYPDLAGLQVETQTLGGAVALNILDAVQTSQADLLVMSSHGRSGFTRLALGSVAEHVIRYASVPVLVLRGPRDDEPPSKASPVAQVALDGSPLAEAALAPAAEVLAALAAPEEGTLHLVRIVAPPVAIRAPAPIDEGISLREREDHTLREAEDYLLSVAKRLQEEGPGGYHPAVTWSLHVSAEIITTLISAGEQTGQEGHTVLFMALATRWHSARERWTGGTIAAGLLEHSSLPLLIVPVKQQQGG